jgi:hypothetical protein
MQKTKADENCKNTNAKTISDENANPKMKQ